MLRRTFFFSLIFPVTHQSCPDYLENLCKQPTVFSENKKTPANCVFFSDIERLLSTYCLVGGEHFAQDLDGQHTSSWPGTGLLLFLFFPSFSDDGNA